MPTLLIINITCNQGSTGKIAEHVGIMMQNKGWDVYYAHGARRVNPSQLKTIPFSSVSAEYMHALRSRLFDEDGLGSEKETRFLVEQIKIIKPDIIHIHNIHGYYLNYKILFEYLNKTNIQIVKTLHDCWDFTGHCPHFVTANCEKWKSECFDCPLSKKLYPLIDRSTRNYRLKKKYIVGNHNLHLVPVSHWLEGLLRQSMYKGKDIRVIQNGIDLSVFKPFDTKNGGKFKILGVANVWNENKGYPDVLLLRKKLDLDLFDITLVGLSQKQIKELPKGINGISSTSNQEELAELYSQSDVLINPTYADTFPTVNLEALACGIPVITYKTGGSPESLSEDTGVVVRQGDVDGLAKAIVGLKNNSFSKSDCRRRAIDFFDKDICFNKYKELFEELTGGVNI